MLFHASLKISEGVYVFKILRNILVGISGLVAIVCMVIGTGDDARFLDICWLFYFKCYCIGLKINVV